MDEENKALNTSVANTPIESPNIETEVSQEEGTEEAETLPTGEKSTTEEPTDEKAAKKGANQRIRELNNKLKEETEKSKSLAEKIAELTGQAGQEDLKSPTPFPQYEAGTEITPEQYQQDVARQADAIVRLRLEQNRTLERINRESQDSIQKYPQLNPNDEAFDVELSESVSTAALAFIQANPTKSVSNFVDNIMKPFQRSVSKEVGQASENLAKQVSQAALRPTSVKTEEKRAEDMTTAELEKKLGVVQS